MKLLEFKDQRDFKEACEVLFKADPEIKIFTPLPDEVLMEKLAVRSPWIKRSAILGALAGFILGFFLQYYSNVSYYPMNVGGRPLNSWPAFLLVSFELGILFSAFSILGAFFIQNRLPRFDQKVFEVESYNQNRHQHFFILTHKEDMHVKAHLCHDIPHPQ